MNVALLADRSDIHTVRWANGLSDRGYDIDLLTMHSGGDALNPSVSVHPLDWNPPFGYYANAWQLRRMLRHIEPDLFHAHFASGYGTLARLGGERPYVLSVWGRDVYEFPYRTGLHRRILLKNLRAADHLCSTSHAMAEQTRSLCDQTPSISITPFGVDTTTFSPDGEDRKEQLQLEDDSVIVGTVKKLDEKYGIDVLIRAFARLRDCFLAENDPLASSLRLVIVGDGPLRSSLERLAKSCGVDSVTTFVGAVPHTEVPAYLRMLDVYAAVSRSDSESFGVAVIEASSCGCPVVVSDAGGLPEVVKDEHTGLVVPREAPDATSEAFEQLVKDSRLRARMGKEGRNRVINLYEWSACLDRMERIYEQVDRSAF
jgi:glycosyltransferase involved in cell wall biosynthesis